jgi:hypothetical protein
VEWYRIAYTAHSLAGEIVSGTVDVLSESSDEAGSSWSTWRAIRAAVPGYDYSAACDILGVELVPDGEERAVDRDPREIDTAGEAGFVVRLADPDHRSSGLV